MSTLHPAEDPSVLPKADAPPQPQTAEFSAAIQALLAGESIADESDRKCIADALEFLDSPAKSLEDIKRHAAGIGELMAYGLTDPSVDALNRNLQMLLCQHYIADAEAGLAQASPDLPAVRQSVKCALDFSSSYFKDNKDESFLNQARALQERLGKL